MTGRTTAAAAAALLALTGVAQADKIRFGSDLKAPANLAEAHPVDSAFWQTAFPDSTAEVTNMVANDDWVVAIYRALGRRNGIDLDVDQGFVIRCEDGLWKEVDAVPLDAAFDRFWA